MFVELLVRKSRFHGPTRGMWFSDVVLCMWETTVDAEKPYWQFLVMYRTETV